MKRIEKISSFYGVDLIRENGESFSFGADEVVELSNRRINDKNYSTMILANGFEIAYRNTAQCTFYEIIEENEVACSEQVEEEPQLDIKTFNLTDLKEEEIDDFYNIKFKELLTLENENFICFALSDFNGNVYIPIRQIKESPYKEVGAVLKEDLISEIITERQEIDSKICSLKREDNTFNKDKYELTAHFDKRIYAMNKKTCDAVIKVPYKGVSKIGFVNEDKVIIPINVETGFFNVMYLIEADLEEIKESCSYLYKKYKKNKRTKGVTDIEYNTPFSFFYF